MRTNQSAAQGVMMTWCLLTCVTAIVTTIIILHISVELEVIFKPFYFWTDACHTQVNTTSPTSQQAKQISSLRVSDRWRFQSQGPKDDISEMCGVCGCTFVCVCPAGHAGVQITLQNTTVLWAQIKRQSRLMCWSSGVSVAVAWSALFCLK